MMVTANERVSTLYICNHPETREMYFPILRLLLGHPRLWIVAGSFWKIFLPDHIIPVDMSASKHTTPIKQAVESLFFKNLCPPSSTNAGSSEGCNRKTERAKW